MSSLFVWNKTSSRVNGKLIFDRLIFLYGFDMMGMINSNLVEKCRFDNS